MNDDISLLIKEAKPLYFTRKRRRKQIGTLSAMFACMLFVSPFFVKNSDNQYLYNFDGYDEEINSVQTGSIIEDMGLPTDEYGLFRII